MGEIFISYSRKDCDLADRLIAELEQRGIEVWLDREGIGGGDAWRAAISNAIRNCDAFLVLLTPRSVTSDNVAKELALAERHKRRIIPVMYEACEIPAGVDYQLMSLHWVDFVENPFEDAMEKLESALRPKDQHHASQPARKPASSATTAPAPAADERGQSPWRQPVAPLSPPRAPQTLFDILPGRWQIQVAHMATGLVANLMLQVDPSGMFNGQITAAFMTMAIQGQWQCNLPNQAMFMGQQSNGFQTMPYQTVVQFTQIEHHQLSGMTVAGEMVTWQRIG